MSRTPWLSYGHAREEGPIQNTASLTVNPGVRSSRRICSGSCDYFTPVYESGRKVAGVGTCENLHCGSAVRVGMMCLWAKESLNPEQLLARTEAR
jgi:hypothetical protein